MLRSRPSSATLAVLSALFFLSLSIACADGGTSPEEQPTPSSIAKVSGDTQTGTVGEALSGALEVEVRDQDGNPLGSVSVSWSVAAGGGSVSASSSTTDAQGRATITWTLGTGVGDGHSAQASVAGAGAVTFSATAEAGPIAGVMITPDSSQLGAIGATVQLEASGVDQYGNPTGDPDVTWSAVDAAIVTVSGTGLAGAVSNGRGLAVATADEGADTAVVRVQQVAAAVVVTAPTDTVDVANTVALAATATDANGNAIPNPTFAWSTSLDAVAIVDADGVVTGIAPGPVDVMATLDGATGSASLTVRATVAPGLTTISPAPLTPNAAATITGTGFSPVPGSNTVMVDGVMADVTAATATELTVMLAARSAFDCHSTRDVTVSVGVPGTEATMNHPLAVAIQRDLAPGEIVRVTDPADVVCNELTADDGDYLITLFSADTIAQAVAVFQVRGEAGQVAGAPLARPRPSAGAVRPSPPAAAAAQAASARPVGPAPIPLPDLERTLETRRRILERNYRFLAEHPAGRRLSRDGRLAADMLPEMGDVMPFNAPNAGSENPCADFTAVDARAVYVGDWVAIFEDLDAPLAGTMDDYYGMLGAEADNTIWPMIQQYIGDPFALDDELDDNGRVFLLFSERVNDVAGLGAMTWTGDLLPSDCAPQSNGAELIYGYVPTVAGDGYDDNTADQWWWFGRGPLVNQAAHLAMFVNHIDMGFGPPEPWVGEALARMSQEIWGRGSFGYAQNWNTSYAESIYCEVRPQLPECDGAAITMFPHFLGLNDYYAFADSYTFLGPLFDGDQTYYDSGWLFARWVLDQYGGSEADFTRGLAQPSTTRGIKRIETTVGVGFKDLLADFSLSFYMDDLGDGTDPRVQHPSWDTRDIFAGLHADYPTRFPFMHPLAAYQPGFGDWEQDLFVSAGSSAQFYLTGERTGSQLIGIEYDDDFGQGLQAHLSDSRMVVGASFARIGGF